MKNDRRNLVIEERGTNLKSHRRWTRIFVLPAKIFLCLLIGSGFFTANSFGQSAYAMQFNQGNNLFGTINLLTGSFTQLGGEGSTLFNDIASSASGTLYGIINSSSLVTLNPLNGSVLTSVSFSVGGIESLALSPGGTLYGATQGALYTINPTSGLASLVGAFNNSRIGNSGQNIRFDHDGNLYDTDGGVDAVNTSLFQISTLTGTATLMGVVANVPGLCLENSGQQMYGVGIQLGSASSLVQDLVGFDLSTLRSGGTNLDGSTAYIGDQLLTANFPNNYNFSSSDLYVVPVPEPASLPLSIAAGLMLLVINSNRQRR